MTKAATAVALKQECGAKKAAQVVALEGGKATCSAHPLGVKVVSKEAKVCGEKKTAVSTKKCEKAARTVFE